MPRNKYKGKCYRCGRDVMPGDGHFEKHPEGWKVQHASCAIMYRGRKSPYQLEQERRMQAGKLPWTH